MPSLSFPGSSNVRAAEYRPESRELYIAFASGAYRYDDVPPEVWADIHASARTDSVGKTVHARVVKGGFHYEKLAAYEPPDDTVVMARCTCNPEVLAVYGHAINCPAYSATSPQAPLQRPPARNRVGRRRR